MKKIFLTLMTLAVLCACNDNVCKIKGTLTDPVDTVHLVTMDGALLDAAAVKNGAFSLQCDINPQLGVSILRGAEYDPITLIPDSKKITVSMADGTPVVTGSPLSQELQAFSQWAMTTFNEYSDKSMALMEAGDTLGVQAVHEEMQKVMADHCREVYTKHQPDPVGLQAMMLLMNFIDKEEFFNLYENAGELIKNDAVIGGYYEYLKSTPEETVITLLDNGEIVQEPGTFEDFVGAGKYTLVDFWASWCGPCRRENPNVTRIYGQYHDKGFEVFSVSLDSDAASWKRAIEADKLVWPNHVSDLKKWQSKAAAIYGVRSIPSTFLLDKEGRIVQRDLRGADLERAVKQLVEQE